MKVQIHLTAEALEELAQNPKTKLSCWHFVASFSGPELLYPSTPRKSLHPLGEVEMPLSAVPSGSEATIAAANRLKEALEAMLADHAQAERALRSRISNLLALDAPQ